MPSRPASTPPPGRDSVSFVEVAAQALRVVPGYQVDQARIADVPAGLGDLPATPMCCSPAGCWRAAWVAKPAHR